MDLKYTIQLSSSDMLITFTTIKNDYNFLFFGFRKAVCTYDLFLLQKSRIFDAFLCSTVRD